MTPADINFLAHASPEAYFESVGWMLRPWQRWIIEHREEPIIVVATRQGGKTTLFASLAWWLCKHYGNTLAAIVCPDQAKGEKLIERVQAIADMDPVKLRLEPDNTEAKGFPNGSIIRGFPGTIKGVVGSTAKMLVFDEAGLSPVALYRAATPMQAAVDRPWTFSISSAWWKSGWFWDEWDKGTSYKKVLIRAAWDIKAGQVIPAEPEKRFADRWKERNVTAFYSPTPTREYLEMEVARHPEWVIRQQYMCEFQEIEDGALSPADVQRMWSDAVQPRRIGAENNVGSIPGRKIG